MLFGKHINKYYLKHAWALIFGVLALILVDYMQIQIPKIYALVVDGLTDGKIGKDGLTAFDMPYLLDKICLPFLFIILAMVVGRFLWRICFFGAGIKVETDLRRRMFDRCKNLSQQYYQVNKVGNLMSFYTNDLETVQDCFGSGLLMLCDAVFLGGLSLFEMAKMNIWLTLATLVPVILMFAIGFTVSRYMQKKWDVRQRAFSNLSDFSQESFSGIAVVKAFVKEFKELIAFKKLNRESEVANVDHTKAATLLRILVTLFVESVTCIILGFGGYLVKVGTLRGNDLVEYLGYFSAIVWPVMAVSELIEMQARGKASLSRISELLDAKTDVVDKDGAVDVGKLAGKIEFKNLTFRYPGGEYDVLKDASFVIEAGENVGIIGKTGSGKTTIVDLLLRTYNVPDGTVFVDGHDVNDITIHSLRENAAYVPQDNFLFSDTIANNISFAAGQSDEEEIMRAATLSAVHDNVVEFKDGYQTMLGERGVTVSGGQKQRISIARALMKNAPILILDDSVSAVDTNTEKVLLGNLRRERKGMTTILIAHRISTVQAMDKIIFIDDGCILDVGTHEELYARCPEYQTAVELQRLEEEKKEENGNV